MQIQPDDIDVLLPFGEALRGFMEQPFISKVDLKRTLRSRGIFLNRNEKGDSIPILLSCLLSPDEFDQLKACQILKEDNPKIITRTIEWDSNKSLLEAVPVDLSLSSLIDGDFVNYKVVGSPQFVPDGGDLDHIVCEFDILREDYTKCWAATKSTFKGKLGIKKIANGASIQLLLTHTAEETKVLNKKFVSHLIKHFKKEGHINPDASPEKILFSSFDNEKRIQFFCSFTGDIDPGSLDFDHVTDFGACPESGLVLPENIKWMQDKVDDMKINGKSLQEVPYIKEQAYHKLFLFYKIEAKFNFCYHAARGTCSVLFEFPDFATKKDNNIEFEVTVSSLSLHPEWAHVSKLAVKEELLRRIDSFKLAQFQKFRLRTTGTPLPDAVEEVVPLAAVAD